MAVYADKNKKGVLNGRWRVDIWKGREHYRARFDTHEEALADEARVRALWAAGDAPSGNAKLAMVPKVHCIASVSQEASGTLWRGASTEETCWAHIRLIGEIVGAERSLEEIETPDLTKLIRELSKQGKAAGTINRYLSHFRAFLVWAHDEGFRKAPVGNLKFRWQKEAPGRIRWITPEEEQQLEQYLPENVWKLVKVAIETGCRRDELLTLERRDVNGGLLHLWKTKTDSPRTIPMAPEIEKMLIELLETGTMPTKRGLRSWWDRAKKRMGLEHDEQFVFHVCRHTCATRLVDQGENLLVIKEWMGHKRIETTQRYAHVKPSNLQEALARRGDRGTTVHQISQKTAVNEASPPLPTDGENEAEGTRKAA